MPVWQGDTLHQVRARRQVYATGTIEQPLLFPGNDLPGVMLSGGARRLIGMYAVKPGTRAVVATVDDRGIEAARALLAAGVDVACVADLRTEPTGSPTAALKRANVEILRGATVLEARGRTGVESVVLGTPGGSDEGRTFACDLLLVSGGSAPATSLVAQAGGKTSYDEIRGHFALAHVPEGVFVAGELIGHEGLGDAELSGGVAGADAAHALGLGDADSRARAATDRKRLEQPQAWAAKVAVPPPVTSERSGKCFACLCEDVTAKDIHLSVEEGYDSIELSKRYTTTTMGPCQGRMCQLPAVRLMAKETGTSMSDVGTTTPRPPWHAVPMGALAGRPFEPAKRSSIHARHKELGGSIMWAGDWRRAYDYGDPKGEAMAVHRAAGLIDVSTLGKVIVRGPDAGDFLDRLYPNRFSNLKPGRIRYGVIASDAGRIMDDGTVCRLDDDTFYVTTTSSGAGAVYDWFSWWLADWQLDVHLTDVTQGLSAVNLAGPRAREIMGRVTDLDCSAEAFTYLDGKEAEVAGVPCLILRIGFVGEVGYEIHCPSAQGEHLWDALMDAGREFGLKPFGLEPQRLLRLQKMHILVGQDTDSESNPFGAAMPWIVKLDKEQDFIGKWALQHFEGQTLETALGGVHFGQRPRADRGRRRHARERLADGTGHERALLAEARAGDRHGLGAGGAGKGRRPHHDLRRGEADRGRGPDEALLRPRRRDPAVMSPATFLSPGAGALAKSPMEPGAREADATFEERDGWNVATSFPDESSHLSTVGFADVSHLGKIEIQAGADDLASIVSGAIREQLELGRATRAEGAWWCPYSATRAVVLCPPSDTARLRDHLTNAAASARGLATVLDTTSVQGAMTIVGPLARETFARFTAIDLRPTVTPVHGFRPGSVARTGGAILCEAPDRYLMLFGAALGQYVWTLVADAAEHLGGGPVGVDALEPLDHPEPADA